MSAAHGRDGGGHRRARLGLALGLAAGMAAGVSGCGRSPVGPAPDAVSLGALLVSRGYIAEPAGQSPAALYFTVTNRGSADDALVGVAADGLGPADIHRTVERAGMTWMEATPSVSIPAGHSVRFAPGALHVMLRPTAHGLARGMDVGVSLVFQRAGLVRIHAPVVAYADLDDRLGRPPAPAGPGPS